MKLMDGLRKKKATTQQEGCCWIVVDMIIQ